MSQMSWVQTDFGPPADLGETVKSVTIRWTDGTKAVLDAMAKNTTHAIQKDG